MPVRDRGATRRPTSPQLTAPTPHGAGDAGDDSAVVVPDEDPELLVVAQAGGGNGSLGDLLLEQRQVGRVGRVLDDEAVRGIHLGDEHLLQQRRVVEVRGGHDPCRFHRARRARRRDQRAPRRWVTLVIARLRTRMEEQFEAAALMKVIGRERFYPTVRGAVVAFERTRQRSG